MLNWFMVRWENSRVATRVPMIELLIPKCARTWPQVAAHARAARPTVVGSDSKNSDSVERAQLFTQAQSEVLLFHMQIRNVSQIAILPRRTPAKP